MFYGPKRQQENKTELNSRVGCGFGCRCWSCRETWDCSAGLSQLCRRDSSYCWNCQREQASHLPRSCKSLLVNRLCFAQLQRPPQGHNPAAEATEGPLCSSTWSCSKETRRNCSNQTRPCSYLWQIDCLHCCICSSTHSAATPKLPQLSCKKPTCSPSFEQQY